VLVEEYTHYVNKLHQIVGLEICVWCQIVTNNTHQSQWPPHATEWNPPWKFSAYTRVHQLPLTF